jgi:hypothetical protein
LQIVKTFATLQLASNHSSVARWHILKPKILVWVNLGMSCNGDVGIFYSQFVFFAAKWYILWPFGIFCGNMVYFSRFGMLYRE